jgi:hypothetical protein
MRAARQALTRFLVVSSEMHKRQKTSRRSVVEIEGPLTESEAARDAPSRLLRAAWFFRVEVRAQNALDDSGGVERTARLAVASFGDCFVLDHADEIDR